MFNCARANNIWASLHTFVVPLREKLRFQTAKEKLVLIHGAAQKNEIILRVLRSRLRRHQKRLDQLEQRLR